MKKEDLYGKCIKIHSIDILEKLEPILFGIGFKWYHPDKTRKRDTIFVIHLDNENEICCSISGTKEQDFEIVDSIYKDSQVLAEDILAHFEPPKPVLNLEISPVAQQLLNSLDDLV